MMAARAIEEAEQAQLLREVISNPFCAVALDPAWIAWGDHTIPKLAQGIYDERAFDRLPILADALEDAGCDCLDLLNHLRLAGVHSHECWAVDAVLGKS